MSSDRFEGRESKDFIASEAAKLIHSEPCAHYTEANELADWWRTPFTGMASASRRTRTSTQKGPRSRVWPGERNR